MEDISDRATIVCCICGISIEPNPSYRCLACLRQSNDMSSEIQKEITIYSCRGCDRYLDPPAQWLSAEWQSKDLLAFCLKRIRNLFKFNLVDADFVYTEPHSKRIKLMLSVQKEVEGGAVLEQSFEVEFVVGNQFCNDCHRLEAKDYWKAIVQIRQKVDHQRTLFYLEQILLKSGAINNCTNAEMVNKGMDIYFSSDTDARRVEDFILSNMVCRVSHSKKLISHDVKSNIYNSKYTTCVDIAPLCKDSLVCLSRQQANQLGGISRVAVVMRVAKHVTLIDPNTAQMADISLQAYYKNPFSQLVHSKCLDTFVVMELEETDVRYFVGQGHISRKHTVCDVWVQKSSEMGTDKSYFCRTHLGGLLSIGDTVYGYDIRNANINNDEFDNLKDSQVPDVVLVKKYYGSKTKRNRARKWRLKSMFKDTKHRENNDFGDFLDDLEEDPNVRKHVNIYKDKFASLETASTCSTEGDLEPDVPVIGLEEMLDELRIQDIPMEEDEDFLDAQQ